MKLQRYYHFIKEFQSDINHISGSENFVADLLSRMDYKDNTGNNEVFALDSFPLLPEYIKDQQLLEYQEIDDEYMLEDV